MSASFSLRESGQNNHNGHPPVQFDIESAASNGHGIREPGSNRQDVRVPTVPEKQPVTTSVEEPPTVAIPEPRSPVESAPRLPVPASTKLKILDLKIDPKLRFRQGLNKEYVTTLLNALRATDPWSDKDGTSPISVFDIEGVHYVIDGVHWVEAYRAAELTEILADVYQGTRREAQEFAMKANAKHGLRLTKKEGTAMVVKLLADKEWARFSDAVIAGYSGVSIRHVGRLRAEHDVGPKKAGRSVIAKNGRTQQVGNQGRKKEVGRAPFVRAIEYKLGEVLRESAVLPTKAYWQRLASQNQITEEDRNAVLSQLRGFVRSFQQAFLTAESASVPA
jgi:hypothetical protein